MMKQEMEEWVYYAMDAIRREVQQDAEHRLFQEIRVAYFLGKKQRGKFEK